MLYAAIIDKIAKLAILTCNDLNPVYSLYHLGDNIGEMSTCLSRVTPYLFSLTITFNYI